MRKRLAFLLLPFALVTTLAACSDDDYGAERPSSDLSATPADLSVVDMATGDMTDLASTDLSFVDQ